MWETINSLLNGSNGLFILIAVVILCLVLIYVSRKGGFSIHTGILTLGSADLEREIIRHQIEIAHSASFELPEIFGMDNTDYSVKYMMERVYDKTVEWVIFNHISNSPIYLESKVDSIYNLIISLIHDDSVRSDQSKNNIREWVVHLVDQLIHIRKYYTDYKGRS